VTRIDALLKKLDEIGADAALLYAPQSLFYASGFTGGEGTVVITRKRLCLLTDSRYTLQAQAEAKSFEILPHDTPLSTLLSDTSTIACELDFLSVNAFASLKSKLSEKEWVDISESLLMLRKNKDITELSAITQAVRLADEAFSNTLNQIRPGMCEFEVAALLEEYMRREAGATPSFDTICASGIRSALPHGVASNKIIEKGDFLTIDFGCVLNGYCSDMTRTVCIGPANTRQKEIYNIVLYAQSLVENSAENGMEASALDAVARKSIDSFGFGAYFGHSLGHGVGLAIHEFPTISPKSLHKIESGDVLTIEPGIYIPDFGGVRIEDMLYITEMGYEVLTKTSKNLIEIL